MRVGVLGPRGTYAELAARQEYGRCELVYFPTITDVAEAVVDGRVDVGVVPVESLRNGSVGETLDALAWMELRVRGEIVYRVDHFLLGNRGSNIKKVMKVLSHPQALAQCREYLRKKLPGAETVETASTARAAEEVKNAGSDDIAALGPRELAGIYGLKVLDEVKVAEPNLTRFLCISRSDSGRTGKDKTSIVFYTARDRPGILHEILGEFSSRRINLTKIESRPSKKALGDYLFFIDLEGHREDPTVKEAIEGVRKKTAMLKVLGSYPRRF
ncbi:MAG: prephenate dehydratase [Candidatus Hadarchaeales archaeon]